eukprot:12782534-Alexandrium_andersonii.AAC.1
MLPKWQGVVATAQLSWPDGVIPSPLTPIQGPQKDRPMRPGVCGSAPLAAAVAPGAPQIDELDLPARTNNS